MAQTAADVSTIRLHRAANTQLWYACDRGEPTAISYDLAVFIANTPRGSRLRVLSDRNLASLACRLYEAAGARDLQLEIGRPASANWGALLADEPAVVLDRMATAPEVAPSLGGWRVMGAADYWSLRGVDAETPAEFLEQHPAWPALSFLPAINHDRVATLLASVVDPRNFINPDNPDSDSRLRSFLGLGGQSSKAATARCENVIGCWRDPWVTDHVMKVQAENPRGFLARCWLRHADSLEADTESRRMHANEATARLFLRYLRANWLNAVTNLSQHFSGAKHAQGLFIPEHFFFEDANQNQQDSRAIAAFKQHLSCNAFQP